MPNPCEICKSDGIAECMCEDDLEYNAPGAFIEANIVLEGPEWNEVITTQEARNSLPKTIISILEETDYDQQRFQNIRVLKLQRAGYWCMIVAVNHKKIKLIKDMVCTILEWPFLRTLPIFWHEGRGAWDCTYNGKPSVLHRIIAERRYGKKNLDVMHQGLYSDGTNRNDVTLLLYDEGGNNGLASTRQKTRNASSKYPHVSFSTSMKKWRAQVLLNNVRILDEFFDTEIRAFQAVKQTCNVNHIRLPFVNENEESRNRATLSQLELIKSNDMGEVLFLAEEEDTLGSTHWINVGNPSAWSGLADVIKYLQRTRSFKRGFPILASKGRINLHIDGAPDALHRLVFRCVTGFNIRKNYEIDHFDHDHTDIRPDSLGIATLRANRSKQRGLGVYMVNNKFHARMMCFGMLLMFNSSDETKARAFYDAKQRAKRAAIVTVHEAVSFNNEEALYHEIDRRDQLLHRQWKTWYEYPAEDPDRITNK
jgi:hypothetical protein